MLKFTPEDHIMLHLFVYILFLYQNKIVMHNPWPTDVLSAACYI
jgi:hypothetical protein